MTAFVAEARKFVVTVCGVLGLVLSAGLIGGTARNIVVAVLGFATAVGVYVVPNKAASSPAKTSA